MKNDRLPTRRQSVHKTLFARLFNQTKTKKQRAAAAPTADDMDQGGINISRSLTIIFAIHIVALGMIFIHKQYLSGRAAAPASEATIVTAVETSTITQQNNLPVLSSGDKPYMVQKGDNYSIIAKKYNVEENILQKMNPGTDIRPGVVLRIPEAKRIIAEAPPEVVALRNQVTTNAADRGLVEILQPVQATTKQPAGAAQLVRPAGSQDADDIPRAVPVASGRTHTVKSGENIWRISNKYKVSQEEVMRINNISDPTKLKVGQELKIP